MDYKKFKLGVTTIELVIGVFLVGVITLILGNVFISHLNLFSNESALIEASSSNKLLQEELTNQIRQAESVALTCTDCDGDITGTNILILRLWPIDAQGEPQEPTGISDYDFVVYKRDGAENKKLVKKTIPSQTSSRSSGEKVLVGDITGLNFTYDNTNPILTRTVTALIQNTSKVNDKTKTSNQEIKAVLRNYE